ncbi:pentapeptide repeat-containing protein, partial [Microcoleus sp. OTE_8_concoct_300]|uniref:pentapeptide repeat-containing protein n=1 Tax=Microcoleus sp. OTE_8_concoct_300 TaxID=2964710 RepID=UPI00403F42C2
MTDLSIRKKKKITISASSKGIEIAEKALIRLGFDTKSNFAKSQLLARSTVTKFFNCQPLQLDSFKKICQGLKLDWRRIAELSEEEPSQIPGITDCINPDINEGGETMLTPTFYRQVTVIDKKTNTIKAEIKLIGDINSFGDSSRVEFILREFAGDTIKITDIKEGSIRLTVEGSQEDIDRLVSLIKSGELKEVSGFPVADVQILSESSEDDESNELNNKWYLVREIVTQGIRHRNLSEVDLSDADLSGANLSRALLSRPLAKITRTGKMPIPQELFFIVGRA